MLGTCSLFRRCAWSFTGYSLRRPAAEKCSAPTSGHALFLWSFACYILKRGRAPPGARKVSDASPALGRLQRGLSQAGARQHSVGKNLQVLGSVVICLALEPIAFSPFLPSACSESVKSSLSSGFCLCLTQFDFNVNFLRFLLYSPVCPIL